MISVVAFLDDKMYEKMEGYLGVKNGLLKVSEFEMLIF